MWTGRKGEECHVASWPQSIFDVRRRAKGRAPPGKVTALVGPSGAGKTTLVRLVPRLWEVTIGAVELGGVDVRAPQLDGLLSHISMVFQDVFLFHRRAAAPSWRTSTTPSPSTRGFPRGAPRACWCAWAGTPRDGACS
ncbi:ATP-binding cassette domain-containing protein [Corallococcus exiguus]|uniref:ATP-binding cassette domain-containing protein n=1 Tax=Corallococcus exiguus TaxID=83462 RepID=UPI0030B85E95